jgi:hypothetical protein
MKLQPYESGKRGSALEISGPEFSDVQANGQGKPAKWASVEPLCDRLPV